MAVAIHPERMVIGPAVVASRAVGVSTPWTIYGATLDDAVARIGVTWADTQNKLNGTVAPVRGLDVISSFNVEVEFTLADILGSNMAVPIPGAVSTAGVTTATSGGASTTTTADVAAGATTIPLTAVTSLTVGDFIKIGTGSAAEYRQVTAISSLNVSFRDPLAQAHASGVAVLETDGDGRTVITLPSIRRLSATAYQEWSIVTPSGLNEPNEIRIPIGLAKTDSVELTINDDSIAGVRVTIAGHLDEADITDMSKLVKIYAPA